MLDAGPERDGNVHVFRDLPDKVRADVDAHTSRIALSAGNALFRIGEPGDSLYVLMAGTLGVYVPRPNGESPLVALIKAGETVGEMALLSGEPRSANVIALRDCELLRLDREDFEHLLNCHPALMAALNKLLVQRLRATSGRPIVRIEPKITTFVPLTDDVDIVALCNRLSADLNSRGRDVKVVSADEAKRSNRWLSQIETRHDQLFLCAECQRGDWLSRCLRQADRVVLVASASGPPGISLPLDDVPFDSHQQMLDLVLLHDHDHPNAQGAAAWRGRYKVNRHFNIRRSRDGDYQRLLRAVTGQSFGLVLSGGGARAYAHLGALRALREAGWAIDFVGGTSMGAVIAACVAMDWSLDDITRGMRECFYRTNPLSDYAIPLVGLVRGHKVERLLKKQFGNISLEELWLPYFCVSSNLTLATTHLHTAGPLCDALRASISLPGILPPVSSNDGLLVDGAVMNNLPVEEMRTLCMGPVLAVDVARDFALTPEWLRKETRGSWLQRLRNPPIMSILMRAGTVTSEEQNQSQIDMADLVISPPLGGIGIREWQAFDRAVEAGYEHTAKVLSECGERIGLMAST